MRKSKKLDQIRVMVMDGSANATDLLRNVFIKLGFSNIHTVNDGYQGIQYMRDRPVHLVFTDWELRIVRQNPFEKSEKKKSDTIPISGTDFVHRLRHSPKSPAPFVPIIMVVDDASEDKIANARSVGANEVISKPLDVNELCQRIIAIIDDERPFITSKLYKGPCRRRENKGPPDGAAERRRHEVRLVRTVSR